MTPSTTSGLSKPFTRRSFIQSGLLAAICFASGSLQAEVRGSESGASIDRTLHPINGVHYLRVQAGRSIDRIEWRQVGQKQTDFAQWGSDSDASHQAEFLLGKLDGEIELRAYCGERLVRQEVLLIG